MKLQISGCCLLFTIFLQGCGITSFQNRTVVRLSYRIGFVGCDGKIKIKPQFIHVRDFHDGLAAATPELPVPGSNGSFYSDREGFIDKTGKFIIPPIFEETFDFNEGFAKIKINNKYGIIDKSGNYLIQPTLISDCLGNFFSEGLISIEINGKFGYLDRQGQIAIKPQFDTAAPFSEGLAKVGILKEKYYITADGKIVLEKNKNDNNLSEYNIYIFGFIDKIGNYIIKPEYYSVSSFSEGLARFEDSIKINKESNEKIDKCGFINQQNNIIIPPIFDLAEDFLDGYSKIKLDGKYGFIDKSGKMVIKNEYSDARSFSNGVALVKKDDGLYGFINKKGEYSINPRFYRAESFVNGAAYGVDPSGCGIFDQTGKWILTQDDQLTFSAFPFSEGMLPFFYEISNKNNKN